MKAAEVDPARREVLRPPAGRPEAGAAAHVEPPQIAERQVVLNDPAQPFYIEGYHRPAFDRPRRRRLRRASRTCSRAGAPRASTGRSCATRRSPRPPPASAASRARSTRASSPSSACPTPGHTPEEIQDAIRAEIERLKTEDVTDDELEDGQDARQGQPDPRPRQQPGPGQPARHGTRRATATGASCSATSTGSRR